MWPDTLTQAAVMADPERLHVLALVLDHSDAGFTPDERGHSAERDAVRRHLGAMEGVGLVHRVDGRYHPTGAALVHFGASLGHSGAHHAFVDVGEHERILGTITEELVSRHHGALAPETVHAFVLESYQLLASRATVRRHLPQLTARFAADRLDALATTQLPGPAADVLFVCVRNAGRSQIAAALMRSAAGEAIRIRTAGSAPAARIDPVVGAELARLGLGELTEFPRPLTDEVVRASGVVVTMGCGDACPVIPGPRYVDWEVPDPVGRPTHEVRGIISDIRERVGVLLGELGVSAR